MQIGRGNLELGPRKNVRLATSTSTQSSTSVIPRSPRAFTYDALSRLATAQVGVDIAKSFSYNTIGNILIKSDVGNYTYPEPGQPFPHAVASISGSVVNTTFAYDANGNQTGSNGLTLTYAVQGIRLETHTIVADYNVAGHSKAVAYPYPAETSGGYRPSQSCCYSSPAPPLRHTAC